MSTSPFRSKDASFNAGEYYHDHSGRLYKAICKANMTSPSSLTTYPDTYLLFQPMNNNLEDPEGNPMCAITDNPILIRESDFIKGEILEICSRFI